MADSFQTLAQLVLVNNLNLADRMISDLLDDAPLLKVLAAESVPFTTHSYVKETGAPTVGFRSANDGRDNSKGTDQQVDVTLKILDASFAVDKALADAYNKGPEAYIAREAARHIKAAFFAAEQQFLNGTLSPGASAGFTGLRDSLVIASPTTVNAGGTTAATGSSVYAIRTGSDMNDAVLIAGRNGMLDIGETVIARIAGATGTFPAYYTPIHAWLGMQIGGTYSCGRICNITEDSGKKLTDVLLAQVIEKFPASRPPTHLVMNRRSLRQLQASRTATNSTGAPAPFPTEAFGIPIVVTDAIGSTEVLIS
jgi:hypothetical protein